MTQLSRENLSAVLDLTPGYSLGVADVVVLYEMARRLLAIEVQEPVAWTDAQELRDVEKHGCGYLFTVNPIMPNADPRRIIKLYAAPQPAAVPDGWEPCSHEWIERNGPNSCSEAPRIAFGPIDNHYHPHIYHNPQPVEVPLDYAQGEQDGREWAAQMAEANHPQTGDWLYDDPLELAKAIRKGPDLPIQPSSGALQLPQWIPCSERMPERDYVLAADFSGEYYLPSIPNTQVGIYADWFGDGNPSWDDGDGNDLHLKQVTHWMPLSAAPQEPTK